MMQKPWWSAYTHVRNVGWFALTIRGGGKGLSSRGQPEDSQLRLKLTPSGGKAGGRLKLSIWKGPAASLRKYADALKASAAPADLGPLTKGGPARWKEKLETEYRPGPDRGGFAIDPGRYSHSRWCRSSHLDPSSFFKFCVI